MKLIFRFTACLKLHAASWQLRQFFLKQCGRIQLTSYPRNRDPKWLPWPGPKAPRALSDSTRQLFIQPCPVNCGGALTSDRSDATELFFRKRSLNPTYRQQGSQVRMWSLVSSSMAAVLRSPRRCWRSAGVRGCGAARRKVPGRWPWRFRSGCRFARWPWRLSGCR